MDFKELHYVLAIEKHGNISSAAKSLGISQPSLSRYLQNLYSDLGVQLFVRAGDRLIPTYAGERYLATARQVLDVALGFESVSRPMTPFFRIACLPFEGSYIPPFAVRRFCEKHPEVRLMMIENSEISSLLHSGQADVAIVNQIVYDDGLVSGLLTRSEVLLAAAAGHPIGNEAIWKENCRYPWVDINRLRSENFILLFPEQSIRRLSDELLAREDIQARVLVQTRNTLNAIRIAATGVGVCFAPEADKRNYIFPEPPAFFSVGDPLIMDIYYVCTKKMADSELVHQFVELVQEFL